MARETCRSFGSSRTPPGVHALETIDVAFLGLGEVGESLEDLAGGLSIDGAEVGLSVIGEGDTLSH